MRRRIGRFWKLKREFNHEGHEEHKVLFNYFFFVSFVTFVVNME